MLIDIIKEMIFDFQNEVLETGTRRHFEYEVVPKKAFICIGVRRCGKSTLLYQVISDLMEQGVQKENILYLNFFDDRLIDIKSGNLSPIIDAYYSLYPKKKGVEKVYFFFDEIQEVKNWEPFIDRIMRTEKCDVFISGSSAKMLSREIATEMRGRSLAHELFPFSFKEFLDHHQVDYRHLTSKNKILVRNSFDEYLLKGGFPEVLNVKEKTRLGILQEYSKTILNRDIIVRNNIKYPQATIRASHKLICSISSLYSITRITNYLRSQGFKISNSFVSSCLKWFQDAYFLFSVPIFSPSYAKQNVNPKKIYCIDHALVKSIAPPIFKDYGYLLENIVFIHLRQHTEDIYYYRTEKRKEVDYLWIDRHYNKSLVQVSLTLKDDKTRNREVKSLLEAMTELDLNKGLIITLDEEEIIQADNKKIAVVPAWKYLLADINKTI